MQLSSKCPEVSTAKRSSMDRRAIEEIETFSMDRDAIKKLSRLRLEKLKSSIDKLSVERCRGAVETA